MAKKSKKEISVSDEASTELNGKVEGYMGPPPLRDESAEAEKIEVKVADKATDPDSLKPGDELLPTDKLPELEGVAEAAAESEPETNGAPPESEQDADGEAEHEPEAEAVEETDPEAEASDPALDEAVDDIVAKEGDAVLDADDEKHLADAFAVEADNKTLGKKIKHFFKTWWGNPKYRRITLISLAAIVAILLAVPFTRYGVLNAVGVRASTRVTVLDQSTNQPLKGVKLKLGNKEAQTDVKGQAMLRGVKLGQGKLTVEKRAFASVDKSVTLGWGTNPLGDIRLTPTGAQYPFVIIDFLSGKPIPKAEAIAGEYSAVADDEGKLLLTIDKPDTDELNIAISAQGYRTQDLVIPTESKDSIEVKMTSARAHVFVSKRSGKFDVYTIDADGKNEKVLLVGTGSEQSDIALVPHPTEEVVAVVSTRGNQRNDDGFLLSVLSIIDIKTEQVTQASVSERIQPVGWTGERLVFVKIIDGTSAANPKRSRLLSYNYLNDNTIELASGNYFNDVLMVGKNVYYSPSAAYQSSNNVGLFRVAGDGTGRQSILGNETWSLFRTAYDKLNLSVGTDWYEHSLASNGASNISGPPAVLASRLYADNPSGNLSLWSEERDGKGTLLLYDIASKSDTIIKQQNGLRTPMRWLNDKHVVYRVSSGQETADYIVNVEGGEAQKIRDVTNTSSSDSWYYY